MELDRLGRSLGFLCDLIQRLGKQGAGFQSLTDGIDTNTSGGKLTFHIMGAMAEFERSLNVERTKAGMAAAKKRGKHIGRPRALSPLQLHHLDDLLKPDIATKKSRGFWVFQRAPSDGKKMQGNNLWKGKDFKPLNLTK